MSAEASFTTLKNYFEKKTVATRALSVLKEGTEIGVVIGGSLECALHQVAGAPVFEQRPANNPDVIFHIRPETVYVLAENQSEDIGEVGIAIFKEIVADNINVQIPGSLWDLVRNGYWDILRLGGEKISRYLDEVRHIISRSTK